MKPLTIKNSLVRLLLLLAAGSLQQEAVAQTVVQVGKGSYASYAPLMKSRTAEHGGDQSQYMQYRQLYIREQADRPIPTNDWWTDLINADRQRTGQELTGHLWSYPQYVQGMKYGLDIHYPKYWIDNGTEMKAQSKLRLQCGDGFAPLHPMAEQWSDWTMTFSEEDGNRSLLTTLAHGMPFTWIETTNIDPTITALKTGNDGSDNLLTGQDISVSFTSADGTTLSGSQTLAQFVVKISNSITSDLYGIYLPSATSVTFADGEAHVALGAKGYMVVALLKNNSDLTTYQPYAYSKPTDTQVSWTYDGQGRLTTHWHVSATDLRTGSATTSVLQGFIPHHYRRNTDGKANGTTTDLTFFGEHNYDTPRGVLKLVEGSNIDISYQFSGMLPWYPMPADTEGANSYDPAKMLTMLQRYADTGTFGSDTYWGGKGLTQMALNMAFAREMNNEALFTLCHDRLKEALVNWLTYTPGEDNFFFAYDPRFHGLIGYDTSYDSDTYNDHHFHYGYFTLAAAMLALVDNDFKTNYGDMIKLVAREYNNYKRDSWSCYLRMMDPWAGHCYAGGLGDGAGNGQESTSESMQGWGGMYLLGVALGDNDLRDAGIFGWVSESRATAEYWFDRHGEAITDDFHTTKKDGYNIDYSKFKHTSNGVVDYTQPWSSNLTSHGIGWWTWFGGDPVFMQGIQWMPISPALDYLGEDKAFAAWDYQYLMGIKEHKGWDGLGGIGDADLRDSDWGNVVLTYRQWSDPDDAAAIFDEGWQKGWGTMTTSSTNGITYFVTHSHRTYGDIDWTVTASIPTARVYNNGDVRYHVAFNPTNAAVTVVFSDGTSMTVPPHQMKVKERDYEAVTTYYPVDLSEPDLRERLVMKNLALGKACTESSHENAGSVAGNATDGDQNTRWGSEHRDNEWLQVDLGETTSVYKVRIKWEAAYAAEYRIELRMTADGDITYSKTGTGKAADWTELSLNDQQGRYVRVVGVKRGTQYGTSLYELEVYGRPSSATDTDLMGVEITCDADVLKQGQPSTLAIVGYDYAKNTLPVSATWSSADGTFSGNDFTPDVYGTATVTATVPSSAAAPDASPSGSSMTATKTFAVEEALRLTSLSLTLEGDPVIGQTIGFTAQGKDQFGSPYAAALSYALYELADGELVPTTHAVIDTEYHTFTALHAGEYAIVLSAGGLTETVSVRGIGPAGLSYSDIPAVAAAPSMSGKLPVFVGQTVPPMNFDYNGGSHRGTDQFPIPTVGGGTTYAIFASQLGTFGLGALGDMDISAYNMIHADVYVTTDAPTFSIHFEGQPINREYAKALVGGRWNAVDLPITNTTVNWLFFAFSDYQAGTNEALVANIYFYRETGDKVFVSDPDSKGIVSVSSFGTGITDVNREQFLADVAALPTTATAIDLSGIVLTNTTPITITAQNPNVILLLSGNGGDDNAASDQQPKLANTQNLAYNAGGWILPLKATDYQVVFEDGYPVLPMNYGRCTKLTYTRTIEAGAFATSCLPHSLTVPAGLAAYELTGVTSDGIEFSQISGTTMEAYKPYLLRNTTDAPATLSINAATGNAELARGKADLQTTVEGVAFVGNFQLFRVTGTEGYAAFKSDGQLSWLDNAGTTVGSFRAYLANVTASARTVYVDGVSLKLEETEAAVKDDGPYYTLTGLLVQNPQKGLYIKRGKVVHVK